MYLYCLAIIKINMPGMKNSLFLIFAGILFSLNMYGETRVLSNTRKSAIASKNSELTKNLDITFGYVPKSIINALKASFSTNNIVLNRFGVYASIEKGLSSDHFANTFGLTASANEYIYFWGGLDFSAMMNLISNKKETVSRRELGIGITPYKLTVIRLGWSLGVGPTISAGIKIPI